MHLYAHEESAQVIDEAGIVALYDRRARELIGFFARRTGDAQLALDLLGDTFLIAYERRAQCRGDSEDARAAWLFRIAANRLAEHYRRGSSERRATARLSQQLRAPTDSELTMIDRLGSAPEPEGLAAAFAALSDEQREAVHLRVLEEQPYEAVSAKLGISEAAARARVSRGLRALRRAVASSPEGEGR